MKLYEHHNINQYGKDFVVGDIHGAHEKLMFHLEAIGFDSKKDRLFSVGDLIDRGPESRKCLDLILEPWFFSVMGNHEDFLLKCINEDGSINMSDYMLWRRNGGEWIEEVSKADRKELRLRVKEIPHLMEIDTINGQIGVVHADFLYDEWAGVINAPKAGIEMEAFLWSRNTISEIRESEIPDVSNVKGLTALFHGHTPIGKPLRFGNRHFIDTLGWHKTGYFTFAQIHPKLKIITPTGKSA